MAAKSLRAYNKEIEQLIERGQTEEAIGHCKYILKSFPKHLETYRLLAKSYLESQRFGEATDIFQRVLSSIPDDFVSHIGMSIIREDEGNLDAAIWHMERAFEVQPANQAIQEELRRLYGRRDGLQPPRIRLTRAALVRMYARGELMLQAISEARAALVEEPQRIDLIVLLARTLYAAGQRIEATERCTEIIQKFPYSYDANLILADILKDSSRTEDAQVYRQRVVALDPYFAFLADTKANPSNVPDDLIVLEGLDWKSIPQEQEQQPGWAESLGIDLAKNQNTEEELPEWVVSSLQQKSDQTVQEKTAPVDMQTNPEAPETETPVAEEAATVPEWLKEAGWTKSTGSFDEQAFNAENLPETAALADEAFPADIPEWLKSLAPDTALEAEAVDHADMDFKNLFTDLPSSITEEPVSQEFLGDGASVVSEPGEISPATPAEEVQMPVDSLTGSTEIQGQDSTEDAAFAWLESLAAKQGAESEELLIQPEQRLEQPPAWVSEIAPELPDTAKVGEGEADAEVTDLPDWLKDMAAASGELPTEAIGSTLVEPYTQVVDAAPVIESAAAEETEVPEWLKGLSDTSTEPAVEAVSDQLIESPAWVTDATPVSEIEPVEAVIEPAAAEEAELPDWLKGLADTSTEPAAEAVSDKLIDSPAWVADAAPVSEIQPAEETIEPAAAEEAELPDWLKGLSDTSTEPAAEAVSDQFIESPAWAADATPVSEMAETAEEAELPEWLKGLASAPDESTAEAGSQTLDVDLPASLELPVEAPVSEIQPAEAAIEPAATEEDAAFAWLEKLAAQQGAAEEELLIQPNERADQPPAWIHEAEVQPPVQEQAPAFTDTGAAIPGDELAEIEENATLPDWLEKIKPETPFAESTPAEETESEPVVPLPDWLAGISAEPSASEPEAAEPEAAATEPLPSWLAEMESSPTIEDTQPTTSRVTAASETLPDWIKNLESAPGEPAEVVELPAQGSPIEPAAMDTDTDAALAWLEGLAANQGASEEELTFKPEERLETAPEWVTAAQENAPEILEEKAEPQGAEVEEPLPDWLKEMTAQPEMSGEAVPPEAVQPPTTEAVGEAIFVQPEVTGVTPDEEDIETSQQPEIAAAEVAPVMREEAAVTPEPAVTPSARVTYAPETHWIPSDQLRNAQAALSDGKLPEALAIYQDLISKGEFTGDAIHDLREALYHYPVDILLWQTLGDAYIGENRIQDALDAYTQAEELLR